MATRMYYVCTICRTLTNSIGELHHHQTNRHTREELSWSVIILRELFEIQNTIPATSLPVELSLDRNQAVRFQNYGNIRQVDVPHNSRDHSPLQIDDSGNMPSFHQQTNVMLLKNMSVIKPVDKYSNQIPKKHCEQVYQSAITSYKPTSLEVEFSQVPSISDESFLKSVEGICDDLSGDKRRVKKTNLAYVSNKTSSLAGDSKRESEQPRRSASSNSYGKKHAHGKYSNVNCQKNNVSKKQSRSIADSCNVRCENKWHASIENGTNVVSICKENCMQIKTEPHGAFAEKSEISSERRITIKNNVLKESKQVWSKPVGSARHRHDIPVFGTRIEQCDEKKNPPRPIHQRANLPSNQSTGNNLMINVSKDHESTFLSFLNPWNNFVTFDNNQEKNKERADVFSERKANATL